MSCRRHQTAAWLAPGLVRLGPVAVVDQALALLQDGSTSNEEARMVEPSTPGVVKQRRIGRVIVLPYAWVVVFFLVPFLIVLKLSLSQTAIAQPPYAPVFDLTGGL